MDTVLSHFKSTGFQQEDSAKSAAANITAVIMNRFDSQISIFKTDPGVPQPNMLARKHGYCTEWTNGSPPKKAKKRLHNDLSRPIIRTCRKKGADNTTGMNVYSRYGLNSGFSNTSETHEDGLHLTNCQLPQSHISEARASVPRVEATFESFPQQRVPGQQVSPTNESSQPFNEQQTMQHGLSKFWTNHGSKQGLNAFRSTSYVLIRVSECYRCSRIFIFYPLLQRNIHDPFMAAFRLSHLPRSVTTSLNITGLLHTVIFSNNGNSIS